MPRSGDSINAGWAHKLPPLFAIVALWSALATAQNLAPAQLYEQLSTVGLDPQNIITVRDASIDKEDLHISLSEGTVGLLRAVDGRVTGALFSGEGEILLIPPRPEEKQSMALFTGSAVLNEHFTFAYLRFDDPNVVTLLKQASRPTPPPAEFLEKYDSFAKNLAALDALLLTEDLAVPVPQPSFLHARIVGKKLGIFDVLLDYNQQEQVVVAQVKPEATRAAIDVWAAFCTRSKREQDGTCKPYKDDLTSQRYVLDTTIDPTHSVKVVAKATFRAEKDAGRVILLHLGRSLQIESAAYQGAPVPVLAPTASNGRMDELFGVVMPAPLKAGQEYEIELHYSGQILTDVGGGLVYVRERGKWYPTMGLSMADFDLTFHYPVGWQLLATGDRIEERADGDTQFAHWRTSRRIPFAGFNLGHYVAAKTPAAPGMPEITTYATRELETVLQPQASAPVIDPIPPPGWHRRPPPRINAAPLPPPPVIDPSKNALAVGEQAARTIAFLEPRLGKFPFKSLHVTQFPGMDSQGFAGLIYLSSLVFLNPQQRWHGHPPEEANATEIVFDRVMAAHETAHQWWGDSVFWNSYREQWLCEALSNYMALMQVEADTPEYFATEMDYFRTTLIEPQRDTNRKLKDAGAVSLGVRLDSSKYPNAYDAVAYGRGTWLIHMLRTMYRDAAAHPSSAVRTGAKGRKPTPRPDAHPATDPDAVFFGVLRNLQDKFAGKSMTTRDVRAAFEAVLPADLRFEGRKSLDWFFDEWVSGAAVPKIEFKQVRFSKGARRTVSFAIEQSECPKTLITSVPIYIERDSGPPVFLARVFADGLESEFSLTVPADAKKLLLDPYRTVLRM
jgi:hypothetical protein